MSGSGRYVPGIHNEHVDPAPRDETMLPGDDGKHACPYRGCERRVSMHLFACRAHWMKVPSQLRDELYWTVDADLATYLVVRAACVEAMNTR